MTSPHRTFGQQVGANSEFSGWRDWNKHPEKRQEQLTISKKAFSTKGTIWLASKQLNNLVTACFISVPLNKLKTTAIVRREDQEAVWPTQIFRKLLIAFEKFLGARNKMCSVEKDCIYWFLRLIHARRGIWLSFFLTYARTESWEDITAVYTYVEQME